MKKSEKEMILKVRRIGGSLTVIIPKDIANLYGITESSGFEVEPISKDEICLKYRKTKKQNDV